MKYKWILFLLCLILVFSLPSSSITQTRGPEKVYKVAVLPFLIHSQENLDYLREGIYDIILSRITVEGGITVIERSLVERALYEERPVRLDEAAAVQIGRKVGADYVVLGSLTKVGDYISLDARLLSISEEKPPLSVFTQHKGIDDVMVKIGDFAQDIGYKILGRRVAAGRSGESKHPSLIIQQKKTQSDYKQSQTFDFEIKGVDIGDVDGDGKNELVAMDAANLYIFKYDGEKLTFFRKIEAGYEHTFLTLDVADLNRDGHAEIVVTSVVEDEPRSFILEYEEGRFKKIAEKAGWFFRVLDHPKEGPILVGQQRGSDGLPVDPIYRMVWKKKSFERGPKMGFPKETTVFGLALADLRGKGKPDVITLDRLDNLAVFSPEGKTLWRSREKFGGTNNSYDTTRKSDPNYRGTPPAWRVYVSGRIVVRDLNQDGIPHVIINKNEFTTGTFFEKIRIYEKGEIHDLTWDEDRLEANWKTRELDGYIADYQVKDVDNDGNVELVAAVVAPPTGEGGVSGLASGKSKSKILFYKLF